LLEKCKIRSSPSEVTVPFDPREGWAEGPPFQPSFAGGAREARDPALDLIPDRIEGFLWILFLITSNLKILIPFKGTRIGFAL